MPTPIRSRAAFSTIRTDALKLGSNIVTYCLAEYQYGRFFDHQKVYHQATDTTRDQLVLGQIVHNGDWDPTPHGVPNLLKTIDQNTTLHVQFKRVAGRSRKRRSSSQFPVLLHDRPARFPILRRRPQAAAPISAITAAPLMVDDAVGSSEFDAAFRREIKLIYPDQALTPLPADHPHLHFRLRRAGASNWPRSASSSSRT